MNLRDFRRAGHAPTLLAAFLYFDVSFMAWVLIGALGNSIADDFGLSAARKGLMVAVPLLGGALLRPIMGLLTDYFGARRTGLIGLILTVVPLLLGWLWADSFGEMLVVGLMLGIAGASFAAALPLASRWYPPQYQGLALGIAGAGNSGTALATFLGPRLAEQVGWHGVFGLALLPIVAVLTIFALIAREAPNRPAPKGLSSYAGVIGRRDAWWFCAFYAVTFGGFVGLASFLPIFFRDQYALGKVTAGNFATLCVVAGSFLRPVGGYLADRLGGARVLVVLFLALAMLMGGVAALPPLGQGAALLFLGMAALGMGNGAVFQLVPNRFPREIGVVTGLVGAVGGLGGFALPNVLGLLRQASGHYGGGFAAFALMALMAAVTMAAVGRVWREDSETTFTVLDDVAPRPALEAGLEGAS